MMTRAPNFAPPDVAPQEHTGYTTQVREYELITPLFGGGAVAQQADAVSVVRVPSIRGQLRFWWRATRGANPKGDLKAMRSAEEALWGMAGSDKPTPSKVSMSLEVIDKGKQQAAHNFKDVDYAIFPLHENRKEQKPEGSVVTGVKFALTITYPSDKADDVAAALWAWETFGGLGARTRRGFGAVRCVRVDGKDVELPAGEAALSEYIRGGLKEHVATGQWPKDMPHLTQQTIIKLTPPHQDARSAWKYLIEKLKGFRQYRTGNQGRSYWPEPDAIRKLTGKTAQAHNTPMTPGVDKFPRAQFGLPIIFHFKSDRNDPTRQGDPYPDLTLQGEDIAPGRPISRFGSPLILRPLRVANGKAFGLAVVLDCPGVARVGLSLKLQRRSFSVSEDLTTGEAAKLTVRLKPLNGKTDVLQAFLDTL